MRPTTFHEALVGVFSPLDAPVHDEFNRRMDALEDRLCAEPTTEEVAQACGGEGHADTEGDDGNR